MQVSLILALPDITVPSWRSGHAAACRAAILPFKSGTWLRGLCGHSREVPPGPIPNPAVKLSCVDYCTQIREFSGTSQRCNPLPFVETYSYCNLKHQSASSLFSKIYKTVLQNLFCRFLKLCLYSVLIVYCTITVFQICSFLVRRERSQRKTIIPRSSE